MNVLGFREACDNSDEVRIADSPELVVPVATPAGLVLLKGIAWSDRAIDRRGRDARDLVYLGRHYEKLPDVRDRIYASDALKQYDHDIELVGAYVLGRDARSIASEQTHRYLSNLWVDEGLVEKLVNESHDRYRTDLRDRHRAIFNALISGFLA